MSTILEYVIHACIFNYQDTRKIFSVAQAQKYNEAFSLKMKQKLKPICSIWNDLS